MADEPIFTVNVSALTPPSSNEPAHDPFFASEARLYAEQSRASAVSAATSAQKILEIIEGGGIGEGIKGDDGDSAYQVAVRNGFVGSETNWLLSLKGADGENGDTPTFSIGTVTAGDSPDVIIRGPAEARILDFVLARGTKGDKGDKGDKGEQGPQGLSIKGDKGDAGEPGTPGDPGQPGQPGQAATFAVGTVSSGASPAVTNRGTAQAAVLDFVLVPGAKGADGATGAKGDPGAKGDTGPAGAKGDTGETGTKGADGAAATVAVGSVTSGSAPAVTNSGTSAAAILNFVLQKGDTGAKGDKGDKGDTGAPGSDAPAGVAPWFREKMQTVTPASGAVTAVVANGGYIKATVTGAVTWTFDTTGLPTTHATSWTIELKNGGTGAQAFSGVVWPSGVAPTLAASGVDLLVLTYNGSTIRGAFAGTYAS